VNRASRSAVLARARSAPHSLRVSPLARLAPHPILTEHEVEIPDLDPRLDGARIAQLSDIHVGRLTPPANVRRAIELANRAAPDVTVLTGDYVCWRPSEADLIPDQLGGLEAGRVIATMGNHDYYTSPRRVRRGLTGLGYEVLANQNTLVEINGAPVQMVGIDDPVTRRHDLDLAFAGAPRKGLRIALCHCPEQADGIAARGADLILSGHTHGGQIFIRGITDRLAERAGRRYLSGGYEVGRAQLYVSAGIGFSGVRARLGEGTRAEVAVFTLRRGEPQ
jgi:uncharacterized protein